jgi:hypothetical protein
MQYQLLYLLSHFNGMRCGSSVQYVVAKASVFFLNQLSYSHILLIGVKNFYPYFPYFMTDLHENRYINHPYMPLSSFMFHGSRCRERLALPVGINKNFARILYIIFLVQRKFRAANV